MDYPRTCRFCKDPIWVERERLKYSTRAYAHYHCYLASGKSLFALPRHKVEQFPYKLLKEAGLLEEVERMKRIGDLIGNW